MNKLINWFYKRFRPNKIKSAFIENGDMYVVSYGGSRLQITNNTDTITVIPNEIGEDCFVASNNCAKICLEMRMNEKK